MNGRGNSFVDFDRGFVGSYRLHCIQRDALAIHRDALGFEGFGQVSRRDRSENASFLGLGRQLQRGFGDLGRERLGVAYQLGFLVGLLLEVLGQYFALLARPCGIR